MADGRELALCSKHDGWVSSCWFSSDSDLLVSVSNNIKVQYIIIQDLRIFDNFIKVCSVKFLLTDVCSWQPLPRKHTQF